MTEERRFELCKELMAMVKGKIKEVSFIHVVLTCTLFWDEIIEFTIPIYNRSIYCFLLLVTIEAAIT